MHRVLEFEDKRQEPDVLPLPDTLSHSLSGSWKQLVLETGKPAWERDQRETPSEVVKSTDVSHAQSSEPPDLHQSQQGGHDAAKQLQENPADCTGSRALLLQLPEVHTVQQARQQVDYLQQQAYFKTRRLQEAKFLARQAAEKLLACQMHTSRSSDQTGQSVDMDAKSHLTLLEQAQALDAAQAHMLGVSEQVTLAELATELAEARASFMDQLSGLEVPHDTALSSHAPYQRSTDRSEQGSSSSVQGSSQQDSYQQGNAQHSGSQTSSSATSAASCSNVGTILPNGGLSALKLVLDRPRQGSQWQQLSNILDLEPVMSPMSEPMTPSSGPGASLSAPPTPTPNTASGACKYSPAGAQSLDRSSVNSSDGAVSVNMDSPAAIVTCAHDPNDCESTSGQSQVAFATSTIKTDDCAAELSAAVLPPLPDVPVLRVRNGAAADGFSASLPSKYVHIGCAVACLCVFAFWAENASAVSLTSRMFPT
ncbi:hypothetical protein WJX77_002096 [Trebouxia sp. C0004]